MRFLIYLMPLWLIKMLYQTLPPTASFRTTLGRVFRLIRVDNDFCLAISSEKYDKQVANKLLEMKKQGEEMIDTALNGLNMLSYENKQDAIIKMARNKELNNGN